MNTNELNQKIENMEAELAEMKALLNEPIQEINYWQPNLAEKYYYVDQEGKIKCDYAGGAKRYRVFKTKIEVEKYAEYIKAEETLRKAIAEVNKGWLPNWNNRENKYGFHLTGTTVGIDRFQSYKYWPTFMHIKSGDDAKYILNKYDKELKIYLSY